MHSTFCKVNMTMSVSGVLSMHIFQFSNSSGSFYRSQKIPIAHLETKAVKKPLPCSIPIKEQRQVSYKEPYIGCN